LAGAINALIKPSPSLKAFDSAKIQKPKRLDRNEREEQHRKGSVCMESLHRLKAPKATA
jgi:hypothetical protein